MAHTVRTSSTYSLGDNSYIEITVDAPRGSKIEVLIEKKEQKSSENSKRYSKKKIAQKTFASKTLMRMGFIDGMDSLDEDRD